MPEDFAWIELSSPLGRPWHRSVLELSVLACTLLVLMHAVSAYRRGDRRALFQWLLVTSYGVQMELIAFTYLQNYQHSQFTIQLYGGQLPLYVTGLYGTFMYTGIKLAERLEAHPVLECFLAGLAMCLIDVPFDLAGVALGWWRWGESDPNLAFRWLGVPVTSYYWYLIFGAVAAALCRLLWPLLSRRPFPLAVVVALVAGFFVIVFGVIGFLPFHAIKARGIDDGTIVATHIIVFSVAGLIFGGRGKPLDRPLVSVAIGLPAVLLVVMSVEAVRGGLADAGLRIVLSVAALVGLLAMADLVPLRRRARLERPVMPTP